jgi:hypothetical protein
MQAFKPVTVLLALFAFSGPLSGDTPPEGWGQPKVAYEATRVMSAEGQTIEAPFHYAPPGKHRQELSQAGMTMVMIIREDLGVAWTLLPGGMYMELSMDEAADDPSSISPPGLDNIAEFEALGTEVIDGWATTRYRVLIRDSGQQAEGLIWMTEHEIPIRMEISPTGGRGGEVAMQLRNLQIREQDPKLFELPANARKMPGFGGRGR